MPDLDKFVKDDWEAMYLLGRIAQKIGVKKNQTLTARLDEMVDVVQATYAVKEPPPELTEAIARLNKPVA